MKPLAGIKVIEIGQTLAGGRIRIPVNLGWNSTTTTCFGDERVLR